MENKKILEIKNLKKYFSYEKNFFGVSKKFIKAVDNISFSIESGETLAIVGESGSGKSTLARTIIGLHKEESGDILIDGKNKSDLSKFEVSKFMQMIFQDPYSSLDPTMKIIDIMLEGVLYHKIFEKNIARDECINLLKICGIEKEFINRYPREFSGGQRQRVAVARTLSLNPKLIIADEPVSALDVSMQAQIINLMIKLQREKNMSYIFISHDLSLVKYIATKVAVMYKGEIVESASKEEIYRNPRHPYTKALMNSVLINHPKERHKKKLLNGEVEANMDMDEDDMCKFRARCPYAKDICKSEILQNIEVEKNHFVRCNFAMIIK